MPVVFDFWAVLAEWPLLLKGIAWTLGLTAVSAVLGLIVGIACAWARNDGKRLAGKPLRVIDSPKSTGFALVDLTGDPLPDQLVLSDDSPPRLAKNLGNGEHWLALELGGNIGKIREPQLFARPHRRAAQQAIEQMQSIRIVIRGAPEHDAVDVFKLRKGFVNAAQPAVDDHAQRRAFAL